jgi:hypothetical protein
MTPTVKPIAALDRVRWLAPDGGWRRGYVAADIGKCRVVIDDLRGERWLIDADQVQDDEPKDDDGNPKHPNPTKE